MALIKCPDCGKMFSEYAEHCPECGCPTEDAKAAHESCVSSCARSEEKKVFFRKYRVYCIIAIAVLMALVIGFIFYQDITNFTVHEVVEVDNDVDAIDTVMFSDDAVVFSDDGVVLVDCDGVVLVDCIMTSLDTLLDTVYSVEEVW